MSTKIYTKFGDQGESVLLSGQRVSKDHARLEAYGTLDELNATIGCAISLLHDGKELTRLVEYLHQIQNVLFVLGSHLACDDAALKAKLPIMHMKDTEKLERAIDEWTVSLPELKDFILPGGHPAAAALHFCRTVCRRAERRLVSLHIETPVDPQAIIFLNRLGDYLFVAARLVNWSFKVPETKWQK